MILKGAGMSQERHLRALELGIEEKYKRKYKRKEEALNKAIEGFLREQREELIKGQREGIKEGEKEELIKGIKGQIRLLIEFGKSHEEILFYLKENYPVLTEEDIIALFQN